ncbi:MAG: hypothetical protein ABJR05_12030 [Balneola sp.]
MNIDYSLTQFIKSEIPQSIILKGNWGIGKTYHWEYFIKENQHLLNEAKYSYVSLFGLKNLDDLKFSIFENILSKNSINEPRSSEKIKWKSLFKILPKGINLPFTSPVSIPVEKIAFSGITKTLICFDDLERKSDNLSIKEVFGLANYLKEQRGCKILFIVNDDKLNPEFDSLKEKSIDRELKLSRKPKDSFKLIYPENKETVITDSIEKLKINNLRIIKRIHFFLNQLSDVINELELQIETIEELKRTIVLFTWINFESGEEIPTIQFLRNHSILNMNFEFDLKPENLTEDQLQVQKKEQKWEEVLNLYRFEYTSDLDDIIWDFISNGILDKGLFKKKIQERNDIFFQQGINKLHSEAWDIYHNSFSDNSDEFISKLIEATEKSIEFGIINASNLSATLDILKDFKKNKEYDSIKTLFIESLVNFSQDQLKDMLRHPFRELNEDIELIIKRELEKEERPYSFQELLDQLAYRDNWGRDVKTALANKTNEQYFDFFRSVVSKDLDEYVNVCLRFGQFSNPDEEGLSIANKTKNALIRIAQLNELNKMRIQKKFKIEIPD